MFQTFQVEATPEQGPPRVAALRQQMRAADVDAFIVPRTDAFQGEYVAPCDARLAWLTGFTGSAGFAVILQDRAGIFIDGRYRIQVRDEVDTSISPVHWPEITLADWLKDQLPNGGTVGFDPWLHTVDGIATHRKTLDGTQINLQPTDNLVDRIWTDRPARPTAPFFVQPLQYAGESHEEKRGRLTTDQTAGATIITLPDSIAWLLNIRGADIERNPVPQAFAVLHHNGTVDLYCDPSKVADLHDHLGSDIRILPFGDFLFQIASLPDVVRIDPQSCPYIVSTTLADAARTVKHAPDPCILPKARKNTTEIAGTRSAHLRDGAAMVSFLAWLNLEAPKGKLTEIDVVTALERFRRATNQLRDISFETICGAGAHGAVVHYRVSDDTNRPVKLGELLLIDSGGQYVDGTTDITRTVIVGDAQADHIACYTRVLQGMIAISRARFPKGVAGQHLDALARAPLWMAGQDYDHGTGHGVGSYLSVHEGPQGISRRSSTVLEAGMILSNEPGYYREGAFGIRIENLIVTVNAPALTGADDRDMLAFETLTYVPLDRRLIDTALLSRAEQDWIDRYHADTLSLIGPLVEAADHDWLRDACAPLSPNPS